MTRSFNSVLVPVDFTESADRAFEYAKQIVDRDDSEIVVVHVIEQSLIDAITENGFGHPDQVRGQLADQRKESMKRFAEAAEPHVNVDTIVCEGVPFVEILRKANDFAVDAIVMSKFGSRVQSESLLFGSTAEKVIRGSQCPVIVLAV